MSRDDTIHVLAEELAQALAPLGEAIASPDRFAALLREMGWDFAGLVPPPVAALADGVADLRTALDAVLAGDPTPQELEDLLTTISDLVKATRKLADLPPGSFPAELEAAGFVDEFPARLVQLLVVTHLQHNHPRAETLLRVLGIVRLELVPASGDRPAHVARLLALPDLTELLRDPGLVLERAYGWGTADFRYQDVFEHVADLAAAFGLDVYLDELEPRLALLLEAGALVPGRPVRWSLKAPLFVGETAGAPVEGGVGLFALPAQGSHLPGLSLMPYATGEIEKRVHLSERVSLVIETNADLTAGVGVVLRPDEPIEVLTELVPSADAGVAPRSGGRVRLRLEVGEADTGPTVLLGAGGVGRVEVSRISLTGEAEVNTAGRRELGVELDFQGATILIASDEADSFVRDILPAEGLQAKFDLGLIWSNQRGLTFRGAGSLDATLPVGLSIRGVLTVPTIHLSLRARESDLTAEISAGIGASIGPIYAAIERVGIEMAVMFPGAGGNLGVADVDLRFKPPSGLGLIIDASVVVGGGYLFFDAQKEEYGGVLQLEIADTIAVKAIGLLTTRMPDGSKGFSLLILISAEGFAPIQLGFGFTLTGVGGLLGVNRTVMADVLRSGLKNGTLGSILFPDDPIRNAPQIVSDLRAVFPPVKNRYVFGPMAIIGWGTPAILTLEIALILEIPEPIRLIILGRLKAILPEERNALIRVRMDSIGIIDFNKGEVSLDATLYDSRILEFTLMGDMALRANWGGKPNFVLAIGGFNPRFPAPAGFPRLERLALSLSSGDALRLRCEAYLALTSNTVQFGARLDLHAAGGGFTVDGYLGIDALFHFAPFEFAVDIGAGVALRYHGHLLMGIFLEGMLSGPTPWHVRGKASFKVLFFKVSVDFDHRIGRDEPAALPEAVDVLALLVAAVSDARNWSSELPGGEHPLVTFREQSEASTLRAHPLAQLTVRQRVVPLNMTIDTFGNAPLSGANRFTLSALRADGSAGELPLASAMLQDSFAAAQFQQMSDDEKLSRSSFEPRDAGIRFGTDEVEYRYDPLVDADIEYETQMVVPGQEEVEASPPGPLYVMKASILDAVVATGAAGQAAIRRAGNARYREMSLAA